MELLQDLLEKQGRIVRLEKQVYSRLEAELGAAAKAADDTASDQSKLRSGPELGNINAAKLTDRVVEPAPTKGQKKRRAPRLAEARSVCKSTAPGHTRKPKPPAPDEDSTDTFSSSSAPLKKKQKKVLSMVSY